MRLIFPRFTVDAAGKKLYHGFENTFLDLSFSEIGFVTKLTFGLQQLEHYIASCFSYLSCENFDWSVWIQITCVFLPICFSGRLGPSTNLSIAWTMESLLNICFVFFHVFYMNFSNLFCGTFLWSNLSKLFIWETSCWIAGIWRSFTRAQ